MPADEAVRRGGWLVGGEEGGGGKRGEKKQRLLGTCVPPSLALSSCVAVVSKSGLEREAAEREMMAEEGILGYGKGGHQARLSDGLLLAHLHRKQYA